jgi:site-specific DNA-methyltransferase (adenine-specific)
MSMALYCGDCLEYMKTFADASIDVIFADPPYGNETEYDTYKDTRENLIKLVSEFMPEALRIAKRVVITPGVKNMYLYPEYTWVLSWVNMAGVGSSSWGFSCWQPILVYGKDPFLSQGLGRRADTFMQRNNQVANVAHPCPKPDNVMRWIIERTSIYGETVLDPFLGSGTTGVACMQLNRNFIGCEIDPKYFAIAEKRIAQASLQPALFYPQKEPVFQSAEMFA